MEFEIKSQAWRNKVYYNVLKGNGFDCRWVDLGFGGQRYYVTLNEIFEIHRMHGMVDAPLQFDFGADGSSPVVWVMDSGD